MWSLTIAIPAPQAATNGINANKPAAKDDKTDPI